MVYKWKRYIMYRVKIILYAVQLFMMMAFLIFCILFMEGKISVIIPFIIIIFFLLICCGMLYCLKKPYQHCADAMQEFAAGHLVQGIFEQDMYLSQEQENMVKRFKEMLNMNEMIAATKKQSEYMALQNQINPHFLYNTLEGIRGETLHAGLEHVAQMTEALATFFRYTISNMENLVTLEDELDNIENYYIIQQYRFGDRLLLKIEYDKEDAKKILRCRLPKLTLQPIIENAVCHGIENMVGDGIVTVKIHITGSRLIITVSDNGVGMPEERRQKLNRQLREVKLEHIKTNRESKGGIAIVNVNNRVRLLFGEDYGIYIYSMLQMGTDVEITLPLIDEDMEIDIT